MSKQPLDKAGELAISVSRLDRPEPSGDWHDKPLRWRVSGPGNEVQKFVTKQNATDYSRIRKSSASFNEAVRRYVEAGV